MQLTARQATLLHGWMRARPFLTWDDVVQKRITLDNLIDAGCRARDVVTMQPCARLWAVHAGANIVHARWCVNHSFKIYQTQSYLILLYNCRMVFGSE